MKLLLVKYLFGFATLFGVLHSVIATTPNPRLCVHGRYYCGSQITDDRVVHQRQRSRTRTLFECESDGESFAISSTCDAGCKIVDGGNSYCSCFADKLYCGYELNEFRTEVFNNRTVYICDTMGRNLGPTTTCPNECIRGSCTCESGRSYCAHELYESLGWTDYKDGRPIGLFRCATNGSMATIVSDNSACPQCVSAAVARIHQPTIVSPQNDNCTFECHPNTHESYCECSPGWRYCGHELAKLGWRGFSEHTLYECGLSGNDVNVRRECSSCLVVTPKAKSVCSDECVPGEKYCGDKLREELGWDDGYHNDTLYVCTRDGMNATALVTCTKGTCASDGCLCEPGSFYCGHELSGQLGWSIETKTTLFRCSTNGTSIELMVLCPRWCLSGRATRMDPECRCNTSDSSSNCSAQCQQSRCACQNNDQICGYSFYDMGWRGYRNHTLYQCVGGDYLKPLRVCQGVCMGTDRYSICGRECVQGFKYCGYKLPQLGYEGYKNDSVFLCEHENSPPRDTGVTNSLCTNQCVAGRTYCGHETRFVYSRAANDLQQKFKCKENGAYEFVAECSACYHQDGTGDDAYCAKNWYWIFGGLSLAVVFLCLAAVLLRVSLRHRRLQRSIEAQRIDANELRAIEVIGKGEFGEVWRAIYENSGDRGNSFDVALKVSNQKTDAAAKLACANCFLQEVVALDILSHPNIIKAYGICSNYKDHAGNAVPALVLEYMNGGNAITYLRRSSGIGRSTTNGAADLSHIFMDISRAGAHLCKMGIIHRDIGARNVLIRTDVRTGRVRIAKLTDFGLAKDIGNKTSVYKSAHPERITIHCRYTAPEGFSGCFSSKSDVWSFGVFMWELYAVVDEENNHARYSLSEARPAPTPYSEIRCADEVLDALRNGLRLKQASVTPRDVYEKMLECWAMMIDSRSSFEELIKFFKSRRDTAGGSTTMIVNLRSKAFDTPRPNVCNSTPTRRCSVYPQEGGYVSAIHQAEETGDVELNTSAELVGYCSVSEGVAHNESAL